MPQGEWNGEYDCVVFGSGLGGFVAAISARLMGLKTVLYEKSDQLGGTLATSGGTVWVPGNNHSTRAGYPDDIAEARRYLKALVPVETPSSNLEAFLESGGEALDFLEARTEIRFKVNNPYPDYRPDVPGAALGYRALSPLPFDGRALGPDFAFVRPPMPEFMILGGMMVGRDQIPHLVRPWSSPRSFLISARIAARYLADRRRAKRGQMLHLGNALLGRCLHSARKAGVEIVTKASLVDLIKDDGQVVGAVVNHGGSSVRLRARCGIVLATGGFAADKTMRKELFGPLYSDETLTAPEDTGDGIDAARAIGAALGGHAGNPAFWMPVSVRMREDGTRAVYPHIRDRAKPGLIAVNAEGERFVNEADSYHDFCAGIFRENKRIPDNRTHLICDRRFVRDYGIGMINPIWQMMGKFVRSGYLIEGKTIGELATKIGVNPAKLQDTVDRHNYFAASGVDEHFGKGSNALNRHNGDPENRPNPCLRPIVDGPFFAVQVYPAPIGTSLGLATDGDAGVLDEAGAVIPGLYAVGSDMASIMGGSYPGPGVTLGPALVFGYRAARAMAREVEREEGDNDKAFASGVA